MFSWRWLSCLLVYFFPPVSGSAISCIAKRARLVTRQQYGDFGHPSGAIIRRVAFCSFCLIRCMCACSGCGCAPIMQRQRVANWEVVLLIFNGRVWPSGEERFLHMLIPRNATRGPAARLGGLSSVVISACRCSNTIIFATDIRHRGNEGRARGKCTHNVRIASLCRILSSFGLLTYRCYLRNWANSGASCRSKCRAGEGGRYRP